MSAHSWLTLSFILTDVWRVSFKRDAHMSVSVTCVRRSRTVCCSFKRDRYYITPICQCLPDCHMCRQAMSTVALKWVLEQQSTLPTLVFHIHAVIKYFNWIACRYCRHSYTHQMHHRGQVSVFIVQITFTKSHSMTWANWTCILVLCNYDGVRILKRSKN